MSKVSYQQNPTESYNTQFGLYKESGNSRMINGKYRTLYLDENGKEFAWVGDKKFYIEESIWNSCRESLDNQINSHNKWYKHYVEKIAKLKAIVAALMPIKEQAHEKVQEILVANNCDKIDELRDDTEAKKYRAQELKAHSTISRSNSDIIWCGYQASGEALANLPYEQMRSFIS